ncbi:alpha/beta hydrolase-fold protein [Salinibacterium sp. G-O1]|uniref:OmpL47-type beta-barrel domain-containing protein n=1 Tax=Salinibacterium sp. G-O1 TaxID=3046208 RepID=UPI0024B99288|nr:alpha/beta hydrolase-fold protein [Salinibacterium sp. G-O1]MDJ0334622.1 alpha/beta hydrolase-fold protein [Salinibacterium sp. G-O1]
MTRQSTIRRAVAAALVTVLASAGLVVGVAPAAAAENSVSIDLEGSWQFTLGDDPTYADPAFDDSGWSSIQVPGDGSPFVSYDGFAWYRLTFDLPAQAEGTNLVASLGFLDDVDEAYLNGVLIGSSGVMPPNAKSQWFEKRLYPVPAAAPVFGGENTLAVRLYDMSGGGGWYKGPVGIFSKDAVRENVYGIVGDPASSAQVDAVTALLAAQKAALAAGDVDAYLSTLGADYNHDGRDKDRRERELRSWVEQSGTLNLQDSEVEVVVNSTGLVVDTNRTISGTKDGVPYLFQPKTQQFLVVDPSTNLELGNHSRFFGDFVNSSLEGKRRSYQVYLPPSYYSEPTRTYPTVYLLHGVNGGSKEWEPRDFGTKLDELYTTGGLAESIVIMPDGESLWYSDTSSDPWRSMFLQEMMPQVDSEYRTIDDANFRALSGVSMGGFGAFSIGFGNPDKFTSIATHIGSLSYTPYGLTPIAQATAMTAEQLNHYSLYFDACEFDEYRFDDAARSMDAVLTGKSVAHTWEVYPEGNHSDACWLPKISRSFGLHSDHFRAEGLVEDAVAPTVTLAVTPAANVNGWVTTNATVTATIADETDSAPRAEYRIGSAAWSAYTAPIAIDTDGKFTVEVRATDAAGNVGQASASVNRDSTAPAVTASLTARTLSLTGTDALSGVDRVEYSLGDGDFVAYTEPLVFSSDAASVRFRAVDLAGNISKTGSFEVPKGAPSTPPVAAGESSLTPETEGLISVSDSTLTPGQSFTITMARDHAGDYVAAFVYSAPVSLGGWQLVASNGTISATLPANIAAGTHRVAVQDSAGVVIGWVAITVAADGSVTDPSLAYTGGVVAPVLALGSILLLLGAALVLTRRRRTA